MGVDSFPVAFTEAQNSLAPYIKSRQEALHIRQVLAAHLNSQVSHSAAQPQPPVLSLVHDSTTVNTSSRTISGLRKEFLKSLRANIKARHEFDRVSSASPLRNGSDLTSVRDTSSSNYSATNIPGKSDPLDSYLALIRQRHRHERLRILQDYVDKIEQKSAAATSFIDQKGSQIPKLPQVPADLIVGSALNAPEPDQKPLKDLIRGLEEAVLRAKFQLKKEKQLLEQHESKNSKDYRGDINSIPVNEQVLQALGRTRNELIAWVEEELGRAGDSAQDEGHDTEPQSSQETRESIEDQVILARAQYGRYVEARKAFVDTVTEAVESDIATTRPEKKEGDVEEPESESLPGTTWILSPYIRELHLVSNEQKACIQQKSHLTVSLAKQHKETMQLFDRLAHESHLLPAYPQPGSKASRRNHGQFELDEMAGNETPSASHRARAWTYAAESASAATRDAVLSNVEEGQAAIESARGILSTLEQLLGHGNSRVEPTVDDDIWTSGTKPSKERASKSIQRTKSRPGDGDIWALLDGKLGVLPGGE